MFFYLHISPFFALFERLPERVLKCGHIDALINHNPNKLHKQIPVTRGSTAEPTKYVAEIQQFSLIDTVMYLRLAGDEE